MENSLSHIIESNEDSLSKLFVLIYSLLDLLFKVIDFFGHDLAEALLVLLGNDLFLALLLLLLVVYLSKGIVVHVRIVNGRRDEGGLILDMVSVLLWGDCFG